MAQNLQVSGAHYRVGVLVGIVVVGVAFGAVAVQVGIAEVVERVVA